ncbi:unnamed protein product [Somion occarium]|uniref:Uncharacterized protein n=1 Tax=Somion occarium TaxID=3059160 RepID=A0ABP1DF29_9APHY
MVKASLAPFLSRSKSVANVDDIGEASSSRSQPRPSSSSVPPSALASQSSRPVPLLSLKLTAPSFLDVVVRDRENKEPVYIIETVRDSTSIYRLNSETDEAIKVSTVQWPNTITRSKLKSGRTVQMANDRWREAEEFLKLGPLGSIGTRKFNIPHYPHSFKWKLIPGGHFYCSTAGANGPFAILDSSVLSAPARLSIFHNCLEDDESRTQENYKGIPVLLLDYLITTSLLLVTEVQEWLDRQQSPSGTVRIPGSSIPAVKKWLAIIHNTPLPPSQATSPSDTASSANIWGSSDRRTSTSSSPPTSVASPTPSVPGTSLDSILHRPSSEEIPPVPPLPQSSSLADPSQVITPFPHSFASSSTPHLPSLPAPSISSSMRAPRRLPKPPILSLSQPGERVPWQTPEPLGSNDPLISPLPDTQRSPSPSGQSSSSGSAVSMHSRNRSSRGSMGRLVAPPSAPPPATNLPLPPKLAQELATSPPGRQRTSQTFTASPLGQSSSGLQAMNPDPLDPEEEAQVRNVTRQMLALHTSSPRQPAGTLVGSPPGASTMLTMEGSAGFSGVHLDAGGVRMRDAAARHSYAETVYEMPPPAYDAIDFSLPRMRLQSNNGR